MLTHRFIETEYLKDKGDLSLRYRICKENLKSNIKISLWHFWLWKNMYDRLINFSLLANCKHFQYSAVTIKNKFQEQFFQLCSNKIPPLKIYFIIQLFILFQQISLTVWFKETLETEGKLHWKLACSKSQFAKQMVVVNQNYIGDVVLLSLLLTLSKFYSFLYCLYCWLWPSICVLHRGIKINNVQL